MPVETSTAEQLETAQRLRALFGRVSRSLRPTKTGSAKELTPTRIAVLLVTDRHGPIRLSELAAEEGLNPTLLSRTVAALTDAGLVKRTSDPDDRRSAWVAATPAGKQAAEAVRQERTAHVHEALQQLEEDDRRRLAESLPALERLVEALTQTTADDHKTGTRE